MAARKFIAETAVVDGGLFVLPPACWDHSAVVDDVAFVCSTTRSAQHYSKPEDQGIPGEYRPFRHLAFIQIKCYASRSLETLVP